MEVELVKWVSSLRSKLWSRLIFGLRKYKLNYLFKYSKSVWSPVVSQ